MGMSQEEHEAHIKKYVSECQEVSLFLMLSEMGMFLHKMGGYIQSNEKSQDMAVLNKIKAIKADMEKVAVDQSYVLKSLNDRFDVIPYKDDGSPSDDYWKWFNHWEKWRSSISEATWGEVMSRIKSNKEVSKNLLPSHEWNQEDPNEIFVPIPDEFVKNDNKEGKMVVQSKEFWDWVSQQNTKLNAQFIACDERTTDQGLQFVVLLRKSKH